MNFQKLKDIAWEMISKGREMGYSREWEKEYVIKNRYNLPFVDLMTVHNLATEFEHFEFKRKSKEVVQEKVKEIERRWASDKVHDTSSSSNKKEQPTDIN